jgi:FkbM family methyltransferase
VTDDTIELAGIVIPLGDHLTPAIREELETQEYEQAELAALRAVLTSDDIVMEIGTGLGFLSAWCARVVGSNRVFTFEANPALERPIRRLYELNHVSPHLEICVLAESAGSAVLYPQREFWGSSLVPGKGTSAGISVPARPFEEARVATQPTLLIVDIEGGELELMGHARFDGVNHVLIELHPDVIGEEGCETVVVALVEAGFAIQPAVWGSDTVFTFERPPDPGLATDTLVRDALAELPWHRAEGALRTLLGAVQPGGAFVLLDQSLWWRGDEFGDRRRRFLVERDGEEYGLPEDGAAAITELNARRAEGARWLAVAWPAFWWLDAFPELFRHLERFQEIVSTRDIRIWELSSQ